MHSEKDVILAVEFESKKNELKESNKNRELLSELYEKWIIDESGNIVEDEFI